MSRCILYTSLGFDPLQNKRFSMSEFTMTIDGEAVKGKTMAC